MSDTTGAVMDPVVVDGPPISRIPPSSWDDGSPRVPRFNPPVSNSRLGMLAFVVFESMLFAGLLGAFVLLRWGSRVWPPAGQPYFPIAMTWVNTAVLLASCIALFRVKRLVPQDRSMGAPTGLVRGLALTTALGAAFLLIQGYEWIRLLAHGLTVERGIYGASFLLLIGTHGLHVLGAVIWLGVLTALAGAGRIRAGSEALDLAALYWSFVFVVWVVLFGIVYLA